MTREQMTFHRRYPIQLNLAGGIAVYQLSVGFKGQMNLDTGMIVSLSEIDMAMQKIMDESQKINFSDEFHFLKFVNLALGFRMSVYETKLESADHLFLSRAGEDFHYQRSDLAVEFPTSKKLFWIYSNLEIWPQKYQAENLEDLLTQISKVSSQIFLVDPITDQCYSL